MDTLIFLALLCLPFINWPVAISLVRLARIRPTIGALTERAALAVVIAIVTTIYVGIAANTQTGFPGIDFETSKVILRLLIIGIGLSPLWWLWGYYRGHFASNLQDDEDELRKVDADIDDPA